MIQERKQDFKFYKLTEVCHFHLRHSSFYPEFGVHPLIFDAEAVFSRG